MKLKPLGDRVIVRRSEAQEKTAGGILLPDSAKNKPQRGEVLAVGPGKQKEDGTRQPMQLKIGDNVLFTSWAGNEYEDRKSKDEMKDPKDLKDLTKDLALKLLDYRNNNPAAKLPQTLSAPENQAGQYW